MFSGIVEQLGEVVDCTPRGNGLQLTVRSPLVVAPAGEAGVGQRDRERVGLGDSICVSGACLTVEAVHPPDRFVVVAGRETVALTTLGQARVGRQLHLERALRVGDRLDGTWSAGAWTASSGSARSAGTGSRSCSGSRPRPNWVATSPPRAAFAWTA